MNFDKGDAVTLVVGEEKYEMLVHASRISANSEFFKVALKSDWPEGQTRTINMPADDWRTMTDYLNFTYDGKLPTTYFTHRTVEGRLGEGNRRLAKLYVLGKRVLDDVVQNAVIQGIHRIFELKDYLPGQPAIHVIYEGTPEGDPARRLLVDMWVTWATAACLNDR